MVLKKIKALLSECYSIRNQVEQNKLLTAKVLSKLNRKNSKEIIDDLHLAEFQVFSQWGDDGIIQFLVDYLYIDTKTFIEFGVENYKESNTRFLLINNNWKGLVIDGSEDKVSQIKNDEIHWRYDLTAKAIFITKENINEVISGCGFDGKIGLLHIDIDGNDYWVWKAINIIDPSIVIIEYNSVFGYDKPWTIPYDRSFRRTDHHYSNLYFGVSLLSLCDLAEAKGYYFIGCNSNGNNAYFIKKEKLKELKPKKIEEGYVQSMFRESRDENGNLTYLSGNERIKAIKGMKIYNTRSNQIEYI